MLTNNAKAYAVGVEGRLFANLVKDAESWISIGIMQTKEKINGATYYDYTLDSLNKPVGQHTGSTGMDQETNRPFIHTGYVYSGLSFNQ